MTSTYTEKIFEKLVEETAKLVEEVSKHPEKLLPSREEICEKLKLLALYGDREAEKLIPIACQKE